MNRHGRNPIISPGDIPQVKPHLVDVSSVFNPGAVKFKDRYLLLLRVQNRGRETFILKATSRDGAAFEVHDQVVTFRGLDKVSRTVYHVYNPRITRIDDTYYIMLAMDTDRGSELGLGATSDFEDFEFLGIVSTGDVRNGVLFPERIGGKYMRLDRPNRVQLEGGPPTGAHICVSESDNLLDWRETGVLIKGRPHYWDELVGSGPPPIRTEQGWLHVYHGVALHFAASNIYQAGVVLLDLDDPKIVKARSRYNILEPREAYELTGQVPNVVFPSGMIADSVEPSGCAVMDSTVRIYYGAADTVVGMATTTVRNLIHACYEGTA